MQDMMDDWNGSAPPLPPNMVWHGRWVEAQLMFLDREMQRTALDLGDHESRLRKLELHRQPAEPISEAVIKQWRWAVLFAVMYVLSWMASGHMPDPITVFRGVSGSSSGE